VRLSADRGATKPGDLLDDRVLDSLFAPLLSAAAILVAVSGGPDSMALLHLLARWAGRGGRPRLLAATVDHGLRVESAEEADLAARQAAACGVTHRNLPWLGPKPEAGLQEAAREARYALLVAAARSEAASHLVTAHTQDDQAETLLMRLAAGSGLAGLAGMRPEVERDGIRHVRPLLGLPKKMLVDLCRREGWPFVEDPSNTDPRFARARWRRIMPQLAAEGLSVARLARLSVRALRVEEALDVKAREAFERARSGPGPDLALKAFVLLDEPFEIAVRVVVLALTALRGAGDHARLERVEGATERLRGAARAGRPLRLTLAGALLTLDRAGELRFSAEPTRRRGRYRFVSDDAAAMPHSLGKGGGHA
jgi:tRNA(Ile)-lysidine synthase